MPVKKDDLQTVTVKNETGSDLAGDWKLKRGNGGALKTSGTPAVTNDDEVTISSEANATHPFDTNANLSQVQNIQLWIGSHKLPSGRPEAPATHWYNATATVSLDNGVYSVTWS